MSRIICTTIALMAWLLAMPVASSQDLELAGGSFSGTGSISVKGNITQSSVDPVTISGTVNMNSTTADQTIGTASSGKITFGTLNINTTGTNSKTTNNVAVAVSTLTIGTSQTLDILNTTLDIVGSVNQTGGTLTTGSSSTVIYSSASASQTVRPQTYAGALTLSGNGAKSIAGTVSITGVTTHTGAALTINSGGGSMSLGTTGSFAAVNNNGTFNGGSGTASFSGAFTQNNGSAALNAGSGALDFNGNLTNTLGTITLESAETMSIAGTFSNAGTLSFNAASTVTYDGTTQDLITATYGGLSLSGGAKTIQNGATVTVAATGSLSAAATSSVTIASGGNLTLTAGGDATFKSDFTNNGTFSGNGTGSLVTFDGATQTIAGSGSLTFRDLTIAGTGSKTASTSFTVSNQLTVNGQNLAMGSNTLTMSTGAPQISFNSTLAEVTGSLKITPNAVGAYTLNNSATSVNFATAYPADYTLNVQPGTNPTGFAADDYVNRKVTASYGTWSSGTATLTLGYRDTEINGNVSETRLKFFKGSVSAANKLSGSYSRTAATPTTFGSVQLPSMAYTAYASGTELIMSDLYNIFTSNQTGNWNAAATWVENAVPGTQDDVQILSHTVTVPDAYGANAYTVAVTNGGSLVVGSTVDGTAASLTTNVGTPTLSLDVQSGGGLTVTQGHSVTVKGKLKNAGSITNNGSVTIQE